MALAGLPHRVRAERVIAYIPCARPTLAVALVGLPHRVRAERVIAYIPCARPTLAVALVGLPHIPVLGRPSPWLWSAFRTSLCSADPRHPWLGLKALAVFSIFLMYGQPPGDEQGGGDHRGPQDGPSGNRGRRGQAPYPLAHPRRPAGQAGGDLRNNGWQVRQGGAGQIPPAGGVDVPDSVPGRDRQHPRLHQRGGEPLPPGGGPRGDRPAPADVLEARARRRATSSSWKPSWRMPRASCPWRAGRKSSISSAGILRKERRGNGRHQGCARWRARSRGEWRAGTATPASRSSFFGRCSSSAGSRKRPRRCTA